MGRAVGHNVVPRHGHRSDAMAQLADEGFDGSVELVIDLGFLSGQTGFQAEGLVFDPDGRIIKAVEPFNKHVPVAVGPGGAIDVYVEAASNPDVGSSWS